MKEPLLRDDAFLADVESARRECERGRGRLHLWWLGQSGFLVQFEGRHLLIDPYLSDSLTKKYAATDKPHVRMTARVIAPERLAFAEVVTSSHNHTDHLDAETLVPILRANPVVKFLVPEANRAFAAERIGVRAETLHGIDAPQRVELGGFVFHGIPAAHNTIERDDAGRHRFLGYVIECGPWRIYHSGDTLHFEGMEELLAPFRVHVALLPINGNRPERRVAGNLDGREAARLAKAIGAGVVFPCHYDLFEFNTASPEEFVAECEALGQPFRVLRNGERWSVG